jgi:hypothetical protein
MRSIAMLTILSIVLSCHGQNDKISLSGKWSLCLDSIKNPQNVDIKSLDYNLAISLPSTLDSAGIGTPVNIQPNLVREVMLHLQRKVSYIGPAYYKKEVTIPKNWNGKHISLKLERVLWESIVWIDGKKIGNNLSLCTPHYYNLLKYLSPGKHTITICIDNSKKFVLGPNDMAHAYTEETQIKWNGILGEISLSAVDPNYISELTVYPDFAGKSLKGDVKTILDNKDPYSLKVEVLDKNNRIVGSTNTAVAGDQTSFQLNFLGDLLPWDEFSPNLYTVKVSLLDKKQKTIGARSETFGFRDLKAKDRRFYVNGKPLFLRGTLECSIFPLTGHPPLDEAGWEKVFDSAREYGLNHLRFHSWCPPDAAFRVADKMGMYIQVELPNWILDFGKDRSVVDFINMEADNIIREYGNHPSFILWSMGNELEGDFDLLTGLVTRRKKKDPRPLYTTTTYSFQKGHGLQPETVDDYYITQNTEKGWVRGQGVFDQLSPDFKTDYTNSIDNITIPVVSHEVGQYSVFPDMKEIEKYKGVLTPVNFIAVKKDLEKKGLLARAGDYTAATGKFATLLYKEEIERAMKTPGLSGFQLLDLHDFPGQGTALVGVLNAFWESKGFVSGEEWRMFCGEVVPLLWFDKAVYTTNETFKADYGIADYFKDFSNTSFSWKLKDSFGKTVMQDSAKVAQILEGNTSKLGSFSLPLAGLTAPAKYTIELSLQGTTYKNQWNIWLYKKEVESMDNGILVTSSFNDAIEALREGKKVLLNPDIKDISGITGKFVPVFWSPVHFPDQPGTMGLLMDPKHPAFREFPTDFYSNWQWWDLCKQSKTIILDNLTVDPIVTVIDNFFKNRKLGNVFEARVGKGLLIFSSVDIHSDLGNRPVARQLKNSLLNYISSSDFDPKSSITPENVFSLSIKAQ